MKDKLTFSSHVEIEFEAASRPGNSLLPSGTNRFHAALLVDASNSESETIEIRFTVWPMDTEGNPVTKDRYLEMSLGEYNRQQVKVALRRLLYSIPYV